MSSITTITQISKASGFSISTVSKALNDSYEISSKTKLKISAIAKKLNYRPNGMARALRNKKTNIIAVIVPQISSVLYSNFLSEIQKVAFKNKYRILILESFYCDQKELKCINSLNDGYVEGIITITATNKVTNTKVITENKSRDLPIVAIKINEFQSKLDTSFLSDKCFDLLIEKIRTTQYKSQITH